MESRGCKEKTYTPLCQVPFLRMCPSKTRERERHTVQAIEGSIQKSNIQHSSNGNCATGPENCHSSLEQRTEASGKRSPCWNKGGNEINEVSSMRMFENNSQRIGRWKI